MLCDPCKLRLEKHFSPLQFPIPTTTDHSLSVNSDQCEYQPLRPLSDGQNALSIAHSVSNFDDIIVFSFFVGKLKDLHPHPPTIFFSFASVYDVLSVSSTSNFGMTVLTLCWRTLDRHCTTNILFLLFPVASIKIQRDGYGWQSREE